DFYIPKQYIDKAAVLSRLNQVVVVDRNQQNQAAFETRENGLDLISYTLSTTGLAGDGSFETPLGSYKVINKVDRFEYLQKNTSDVAGYAPFAIRFTGGAYIHGVPVEYEEKNGEKVDPGSKEYLHTIGTFPRSHMCVRNFTSHAEFLYNWMDGQNGAVIVIE
ncbi:MAG: L,D-transpeptidase, partial [Syntrophomonadaceae bacterium]|nr:L,D-transpeptidase [Syntrophomonadaceae bacterium]